MGVKQIPGQRWIVEKDERMTAIDDWKEALDQLVRISNYLAEHYPESKGRNIDEVVIEILELHRKSEFYRAPAKSDPVKSGVEVVEPEESVAALAESEPSVVQLMDDTWVMISRAMDDLRRTRTHDAQVELLLLLGQECLLRRRAAKIRDAKKREVEAEVSRHRKGIEEQIAGSIQNFLRSTGSQKEG
jgi:hypothetical protein